MAKEPSAYVVQRRHLEVAQDLRMSQAALARHLGVSHSAVLRAERREDMQLRREGAHSVPDYRAIALGMSAEKAVNYLLDALDVLTAPPELLPEYVETLSLTQMQGRVYAALFEARGRFLSREFLMTLVYFDQMPDDWPSAKVIDVYVCKIRQRMREVGTPDEIVTRHSYGFALQQILTQPNKEPDQ